MSTSTEFGIKVSRGRNTDKAFSLIEASKLSLDDEIMKHKPKTAQEKEFKERLIYAINSKLLRDFWAPKYDPSFYYDTSIEDYNIIYGPGNDPALGANFLWWFKTAKNFKPECGSRIGSNYEHDAFLAILMKKLISQNGFSVSESWDAVCNNSTKLAYYYGFMKEFFVKTGSIEVCGFCDLGNTGKLLMEHRSLETSIEKIERLYQTSFYFWMAGGTWGDNENLAYLTVKRHTDFLVPGRFGCGEEKIENGVAWIICEKDPNQ